MQAQGGQARPSSQPCPRCAGHTNLHDELAPGHVDRRPGGTRGGKGLAGPQRSPPAGRAVCGELRLRWHESSGTRHPCPTHWPVPPCQRRGSPFREAAAHEWSGGLSLEPAQPARGGYSPGRWSATFVYRRHSLDICLQAPQLCRRHSPDPASKGVDIEAQPSGCGQRPRAADSCTEATP